MNIIDKIKSFSFIRKNKPVSAVSVDKISMSEREEKVFGEGKLTLQKLYETWSCKEQWLLFDEGIPLLFGLEPGFSETLDDDVENKIDSLRTHAQECVQKKLLPVINIDMPESEWQVSPVDFYCWATVSRISMPEELSRLMTFVVQTVKLSEVAPDSNQKGSKEDMLYQKHREIVLGAATSLLVNTTELCKNKKGRVVSNKIARLIMENEDLWFGNDRPLLTEVSITDLIDEYLKIRKPELQA